MTSTTTTRPATGRTADRAQGWADAHGAVVGRPSGHELTEAGRRAARRRDRRAALRRPPSALVPSGARRSVPTAAGSSSVACAAPSLRVVAPVGPSRRMRLATTLTVAVALGAIAFRLFAGMSEPAAPREVTVQPGDTLVSIAVQVEPGSDPALVVREIKALNELTGDDVAVGDRLQVPAAG
ncbi:LysM peptidoglycan-binding domain-containing protein [Nakamurella alba]|nr:LysM peptidoglycan-binding domain-containing protein [Nakamurella alba]